MGPAKQWQISIWGVPSNKRWKLSARVDCGMNAFSSARRSLSAIR